MVVNENKMVVSSSLMVVNCGCDINVYPEEEC